ncbi:hypothetical protein [Streptomyces beihaiensis]|uniref:Uncharacterized protein n=1 Tax=Streptomyces beihaiensis TaxID=2984495 RepID=A0ABT3TNE2_9ACTN|nr:hypothetical protein [Streptomyces beihaiensis]MCX3058567.1 hypothetical protein [Streptomyces beihaiensis]
MSWTGHWHGYGPWVGDPKTYAQEGSRRPPHPNGPPSVTDPEDKKQQQVLDRYREAAAEFQTGNVPPTMTGYWLTKKSQTSADRTWADVDIALEWLTKKYEENPPFERADGLQAYSSLDTKLEYASDVLPFGVDVSWVYYTPAKNLMSFSVVCCLNRFHPEIPCPLPPA